LAEQVTDIHVRWPTRLTKSSFERYALVGGTSATHQMLPKDDTSRRRPHVHTV
jgi:hypothetical protein